MVLLIDLPSAIMPAQAAVAAESQTMILPAEMPVLSVAPGGSIGIKYHWVGVPMTADYTVFVHVVDDKGAIVFQDDHQLQPGRVL